MAARWVTFDCFGTLVDWHTGFTAVLRDVAAKHGSRYAAELQKYVLNDGVMENDASDKYMRLMVCCDAFNLPIITFVDTPAESCCAP